MNYQDPHVAWQSNQNEERISYSLRDDGEILMNREFFDPEFGWLIDESFCVTNYQWEALVESIAESKQNPERLKSNLVEVEVSGLQEPIQ
jgi:hypothetical protein